MPTAPPEIIFHHSPWSRAAGVRWFWPLQLAYYEGKEIVAAWCCLREDFRFFRVGRVTRWEITNEPYGRPRRALSRELFAMWERRRAEAEGP